MDCANSSISLAGSFQILCGARREPQKKVFLESDLALFVRQVYNTNVLQVQARLAKSHFVTTSRICTTSLQGRLLQLRQHKDALPHVLLAKVAELLRLHPRL